MKTNISVYSLALFLTFSAFACGDDDPPPPPDEQPSETWTLGIYMAADNNLDPFASRDLVELTQNGPPEGVEVLLFIDRSEAGKYSVASTPGFPDFNGAKVFLLDASNSWEELDDLGEVNSTDASTIHDFINRVKDRGNDREMIVFWDHGSPRTYGSDETDGRGGVRAEALQSAFRTDPADDSSEFMRIDIIGFDTCLLSSATYLATMSPVADVYIGSAELEPGDGWDYDGVMRAFYDDDLDVDTLATSVVEAYGKYYRDNPNRDSGLKVTLAAWSTDLTAFAIQLLEFDEQFQEDFEAEPEAVYTQVKQAVAKSHPYWDSGTGQSRYVDFGNMMGSFDSGDAELDQQAADVVAELESLQIAYTSSSTLPGTLGLNYTVASELIQDIQADSEGRSTGFDRVLRGGAGSPEEQLIAADAALPMLTTTLGTPEPSEAGYDVTNVTWDGSDDTLLESITILAGVQESAERVLVGVAIDLPQARGVKAANSEMGVPLATMGFSDADMGADLQNSAVALVVRGVIYIPVVWQLGADAGTAFVVLDLALRPQGAAIQNDDETWAVIPWEDIADQPYEVAPLRTYFNPMTSELSLEPGEFNELATLQIAALPLEGDIVTFGVAEDVAGNQVNTLP